MMNSSIAPSTIDNTPPISPSTKLKTSSRWNELVFRRPLTTKPEAPVPTPLRKTPVAFRTSSVVETHLPSPPPQPSSNLPINIHSMPVFPDQLLLPVLSEEQSQSEDIRSKQGVSVSQPPSTPPSINTSTAVAFRKVTTFEQEPWAPKVSCQYHLFVHSKYGI